VRGCALTVVGLVVGVLPSQVGEGAICMCTPMPMSCGPKPVATWLEAHLRRDAMQLDAHPRVRACGEMHVHTYGHTSRTPACGDDSMCVREEPWAEHVKSSQVLTRLDSTRLDLT